jgi:hypothetical protein
MEAPASSEPVPPKATPKYREIPQKGDVILAFSVGTPLYGAPTPELPYGKDQFGHRLDRPEEPIRANPAKPRNGPSRAPQTYANKLTRRIPVPDPASNKLVSPPVKEAMEEARKKMANLLAPITERTAKNELHSLWVPRPDTLAGAFTDGALESFMDVLDLPSRLVVAYCQHRGGKLLYFLSKEDKAAFREAVGVSTLVKVGAVSHLFRVTDPSQAAHAVTFLVLGVPWAASDEEVGALLSLIASPNPRCKLVSWTRMIHKGTVTDKVAARWTIAPEMVLTNKSVSLGDFSLSFAPQEHSLRCSTCKVKGHDDRRCPFTGESQPPTPMASTKGDFQSTADFLAAVRGGKKEDPHPPAEAVHSNTPNVLAQPPPEKEQSLQGLEGGTPQPKVEVDAPPQQLGTPPAAQASKQESPSSLSSGLVGREGETAKGPTLPPQASTHGSQKGSAQPNSKASSLPMGVDPTKARAGQTLSQRGKASEERTDRKAHPSPSSEEVDILLREARKESQEKGKEEREGGKPKVQGRGNTQAKAGEKEARIRDAGHTPPSRQHTQQHSGGFKVDAPDSPKGKLLGGRGGTQKGHGPNDH